MFSEIQDMKDIVFFVILGHFLTFDISNNLGNKKFEIIKKV